MTKVLLIVDMVRGFLDEKTEDGPCALYLKGAKSIIPNIKREIDALGEGDRIAFVCDSHRPDDKEFERWPKHCIERTEESEPVDELWYHALDTRRGAFKLFKTRFSGFYESDLDFAIRVVKPDELVIVGVCTDICVFATALDACYRGYKVTIPKDCVFPLYPERGDYLLKYLVDMFGVTVR